MLNVRRDLVRCDGVTRRDVLRLGSLTALGLSVSSLATPRAASARPVRAKANACILIWLDGGPSHLETFDPKPDASPEVRGPFSTIATSVPGFHISEPLPNLARRLARMAIIRSMTSPLGEHNLGSHYLLTGYQPTPALDYPSYGAVMAHLKGGQGVLPPYVALPSYNPAAGAGYLPKNCRPFAAGGDPAQSGFRIRDLDAFPGVTGLRMARRREYLEALNRFSRSVESAPEVNQDPAFEQAYRLIMSPDARRAFDLAEEPAPVRDRYGRKTLGQACLLARRLIERGVPFVTVNDRGWDTHDNLMTRLKEGYTGAKVGVGLLPTLDRALSALLDDLHQRRRLDETLVVVMGEFGRTPKLNTSGGRDHWPRVFSVLLAGGGVAGGQVIGASDSQGESPAERPITPADLACTIYDLLGVNPAHELATPDARPIRINQGGTVIPEIAG
jgi:hypothetical protein